MTVAILAIGLPVCLCHEPPRSILNTIKLCTALSSALVVDSWSCTWNMFSSDRCSAFSISSQWPSFRPLGVHHAAPMSFTVPQSQPRVGSRAAAVMPLDDSRGLTSEDACCIPRIRAWYPGRAPPCPTRLPTKQCPHLSLSAFLLNLISLLMGLHSLLLNFVLHFVHSFTRCHLQLPSFSLTYRCICQLCFLTDHLVSYNYPVLDYCNRLNRHT